MIDFGALFPQLLAPYWWLLPLFILAALFKSAWFKGFIGEVMVNMAARLFLNKNVTIPTEDSSPRLIALSENQTTC